MPNVSFDNTIVYYEKYGEGIPIIFIHPPGLGGVVFEHQLPLANYYQLIIPDLSGHGYSVGPLADDPIKQYAKELKTIIIHENLSKVVLCAYSAGGTIAQYFVREYPELVEALIISGAYPKVSTWSLDTVYRLGMATLKLSPKFLAKRLAASNSTNRSDKKQLLQYMKKSSVNHWYAYYLTTYYYDVRKFIDNISCPSLFIYGNETDFTHDHQAYYYEQEHIQIAFVEKAAHQIPTKKYIAFNHLVKQFIDRVV